MKKEFIQFEEIRNAGIKIAYQMYKKNFIPDVLYVLLRGGAYLGNIISDYFKVMLPEGHKEIFFGAVVARSYTNSFSQEKAIAIDGWTYHPRYLRKGDKVLLVDDVFDTGRTINHLAGVIQESGIQIEDCKIAVYDYKIRPENQNLPFKPEFYANKVYSDLQGKLPWRHYLTHEIVGMTREEACKNLNFKGDREVEEAIFAFIKRQEALRIKI